MELSVALLAASAALTPSLLPKSVLVHGVVTGLAAAAGYGIGALLRWLLTPLRRRIDETLRTRIAWAFFAGAAVTLVPAAWLSHLWQRDLAAAVEKSSPPPGNAIGVLIVAGVVLAIVVLVARGLKAVTRWGARWLARWMPGWLALTLASLLVAGATTGVTDIVVRNQVLASVDESFRLVNAQSHPDLAPPDSSFRSGGPESLVPWSTLGRAGQEFVSLPAPPYPVPPIRVYAGIDSARDLTDRAELVVAELERTGAFTRAVVCLVVPTGTGWVDPAAVRALERLWDGNTAIASMQYSYLPSVLSLVADRNRVDTAATVLLGAVVRRWQSLPEESRPRLVLYGESLGSQGVEVAMRDVPGATDVVDGVLLAGPPNANPTWSSLVANRDPGSPMLAPVVDGGKQVRFWPGPEMPEYDRRHDPWPKPSEGPRILYLQHPSDPVVWWSPSLLWSEPPWVAERDQVSKAPPLRWRPVVTFWQITGDILFAIEVPEGHGHKYGSELADAWAAVLPLDE